MNITRECLNLSEESFPYHFSFDNICTCSRCQTPIQCLEIKPVFYTHEKDKYITLFNFCHHCNLCFMTTFSVREDEDEYGNVNDSFLVPIKQIASEPITPDTKNFSQSLTEISPSFVEIYNQAYRAEIYSLNHIAGMGYRKALEFLIKDYAIHFNQTKEDSIKNQSLAQCIKTYIDNPKIQTLAERSAWLGNDEVHYVRKHPDYDINDLKRFIDTCVNYIDMELNLEQCNLIHKA